MINTKKIFLLLFLTAHSCAYSLIDNQNNSTTTNPGASTQSKGVLKNFVQFSSFTGSCAGTIMGCLYAIDTFDYDNTLFDCFTTNIKASAYFLVCLPALLSYLRELKNISLVNNTNLNQNDEKKSLSSQQKIFHLLKIISSVYIIVEGFRPLFLFNDPSDLFMLLSLIGLDCLAGKTIIDSFHVLKNSAFVKQ